MNREEKIKALREELKTLSAGRYKRFNALLKTENFEKLEKEAKRKNTKKSKIINQLIKNHL